MPDEQPQPQESLLAKIVRLLVIYWVATTLSRHFFGGSKDASTDPDTGEVLPPYRPLWNVPGADMQIAVVFDTRPETTTWQKKAHFSAMVRFSGDASNSRRHNVTVKVPESVRNRNGTMYAHIFVVRPQFIKGENVLVHDPVQAFQLHHPMVEHMPKRKDKVMRNLISGELEGADLQVVVPEEEERPIVGYFKPSLTIRYVYDAPVFKRGSIPVQLQPHIKVIDAKKGQYLPIIEASEFWLRKDQLVPVNDTLKEVTVDLQIVPISLMKWTMQLQMEESFRMQEKWGSVADGEKDEIKRMMSETNVYLLGVTFVVSILHMIFDFLAFKSDVQFWRNRKTVKGISVKSIFVSVFCQIVVLLYLLDNDTSWMIVVSTAIGIVIEMWKITKAMIVTLEHIPGAFLVPYRIRFQNRHSYTSSNTKQHDEIAMRYMGYLSVPLIIGYSVYSLMYKTHKSWYSFVLQSLVGAVYWFGFIFFMTPQILINARLKSTAHLNWTRMTFKVLNTVIDDLYAFVADMPTLSRVACFRDDLIFVIYLYQRWKYGVDKNRVEGADSEQVTLTDQKRDDSDDDDDKHEDGKEKKE